MTSLPSEPLIQAPLRNAQPAEADRAAAEQRKEPASRRAATPGSAPLPQRRTESRFDVLTGRWTLFATERGERPNEYIVSTSLSAASGACPFCTGHEEQTPPPVMILAREDEGDGLGDADSPDNAIRSGDGTAARKAFPPREASTSAAATSHAAAANGEWVIRVIPNKYPAVEALPDSSAEHPESAASRDGHGESAEMLLFPSRPVTGGHEVIIESPEHVAGWTEMDLSHVIRLLRVYQSRLDYWRQPGVQYLSLFKNVGAAAGASLSHPHSQLIALSELPRAVKTLVDRCSLHHARTGCCLQCDIVRAELKAKQRIVAMTDSLIAYCPFASSVPMLLRITTRRHADCFESLSDRELDELARLTRRAVGWLRELYPDIAYNIVVHTRPPAVACDESFHWAFELFPRMTQTAGFEWSCDTTINPMLPEDCAGQLREVAMRENPLRY